MRVVILHGQSHEGSTCMVARELVNKVGRGEGVLFTPGPGGAGMARKRQTVGNLNNKNGKSLYSHLSRL